MTCHRHSIEGNLCILLIIYFYEQSRTIVIIKQETRQTSLQLQIYIIIMTNMMNRTTTKKLPVFLDGNKFDTILSASHVNWT